MVKVVKPRYQYAILYRFIVIILFIVNLWKPQLLVYFTQNEMLILG